MKMKMIVCCAIVAAISASPAFAAGKKKMTKQASTPGTVVAGAAGAAGAVATGAVATAGAIATAPFNPALMGPPSTINSPTCKPGSIVTINGQKMRCQ